MDDIPKWAGKCSKDFLPELKVSHPSSKIEEIREWLERSRELRRQQQIDTAVIKLLISGGYNPNTLTPIEEDNSRKAPVNETYSEPLSRITEEPTHDETMNNIMKKFHS